MTGRGALHGLGGIVNQVDDDAPQQLVVRLDERQARRKIGVDGYVVEASLKYVQRPADDTVRFSGSQSGHWKSRELRKLGNQRLESTDFPCDQRCALSNQPHEFRWVGRVAAAVQVAQQALD